MDNPAQRIEPTDPQTQPAVAIEPEQATRPIDPVIASVRASHAHYGLSGVMPELNYDDYYKAISSGQEDDLRTQVSEKLNGDITNKKQQAVLAAANGGELTPESYDTIDKAYKPTYPHTVFEEAFGKQYVEHLFDKPISQPQRYAWLQATISDTPEIVYGGKEKASTFVSKVQIIHRLMNENNQEIEDQSTGRYLLDTFLKPLVPGYTSTQFGTLLAGESFDKERQELFGKPLEEFEPSLREKLTNLTPAMRSQYLQAMKGQSLTDKAMNNVFPLLDVTALGGVAKLGVNSIRAVRNANKLQQTFREIAKSTETLDTKPVNVNVADALGDLKEAGAQAATTSEIKGFSGLSDPVKEALEAVNPILNPFETKIKDNPGGWGQDSVNKYIAQRENERTTFFQKVQSVLKVQRIPAVLATEGVVRDIMEQAGTLYKGLNNQIVGTSNNLIYNKLTNNHGFFIFFGDSGGEAFHDSRVAVNAAKEWGFATPEVISSPADLGATYAEGVIPKGTGFLVAKYVPLNETQSLVRDSLIKTGMTDTPYSWLPSFMSWLRTPEETLSVAERANRGAAEFVPQALLKEVQKSIQDVRTMARKSFKGWRDWERAIKYSQEAEDPITKKPGYFFAPHELDDYYQRTFQRLPEEAEYRAYYAYQDALDKDWVLRNLRVYSNMSRVGTESHRFWYVPKKGQETTISPWFNGVKRDKLPGGTDAVLVLDGKGKATPYYADSPQWLKVKKELSNDIEQGIQNVIEVYDPDLKELKKWTDKRVRYVISPNVETRNLPIFNVPRRGGGHFEYDYPHWIRQAKVNLENIGQTVKQIYTGDSNFGGVTIRAVGNNYVKHLNAVREMLLDSETKSLTADAGKLAQAEAYNNQHLGINWEKHLNWYKPSKDPDGFEVAPRFSVNEPFHLTEKGQRVANVDWEGLNKRYGDNFVDGTRKGSLARNNQVEFTSERDAHDLMAVTDEGSKGNPIYKTSPAALVDPIASLNRGLSRIISSFMMDDYKTFAVEHWIEEAKGLLKAEPSDLRYSPYKYFYEPEWQPNLKGEQLEQKKFLEANNWKIRQFLGVPDRVSTELHSATQRLVDEIYGKAGPKLTPSWLLPAMRDPYSDIRSFVFHLKLGLFNWAQFFKQASTFVNVLGMAGPKYAGPGAAATLLHQWARISPGMMDKFDGVLSGLNIPGMSRWRAGEFKESWEAAQRTGFLDGVHSHIFLDAPLSNEILKSKWATMLDWGSVFFKEGANNTKIASWHTAFKEWRDTHPTGAIADSDLHDIFLKARMYNHNMDRASASVFQGGIGSIPVQFKSYTLRLAELMTGKRLTPIQKARFFATASGFYGVPLAFGLYGAPGDDIIRPVMQKHGYVPGDNVVDSLFMEGMVAPALSFITGGGDMKKGRMYDIGQQFGPTGYTEYTQLVRTDASMLWLLTGAAGSTFANAIALSDPFWMWLHNGVTGRGNDAIKPDDVITAAKSLLQPARESSSVNRALTLYLALKTGQWMSKNETYLADTNTYDAMFMTAFGLQPKAVTDTAALETGIKEREQIEKLAEQRFRRLFRKSFESLKNNDMEQATSYKRLAFSALALYPREKWHKLIAETSNDFKALIDSVPDRFYLQTSGLSPEDQQVLLEAFQKLKGIKR